MALLAKESAVVQMETKSISVCDSINFNGYCRCDLCNPRFLRCSGETKLGKDHPDTLQSLNNLGMVFHAQGHLAEAERLFRDALQRSPGAQLQRFRRGSWAVDLESHLKDHVDVISDFSLVD